MDSLYRQANVIYYIWQGKVELKHYMNVVCESAGSRSIIDMTGPMLRSIRDRARADARSTPLNVFSSPTLVSYLSFPLSFYDIAV